MDRKQLISGVAVAVAVVALWFGILHFLEWREPQLFAPQPTNQQADQTPPQPTPTPSTTAPAQAVPPSTQSTVASGSTTAPATAPTVTIGPTPPPAIAAAGATSPQPAVVLGGGGALVDPASKYAMKVILSPTGAAVDSITLNRFGSADNRKIPYVFQTPYADHPESAALATRSITVNSTTVDLSGVDWKVAPGNTPSLAAFVIPLVDPAGHTVATVTKTYTLSPFSTDPTTSQGYELSVNLSVQNASAAPMSVQAAFNGPTMPPREIDRGDDRAVIIATATAPDQLGVTQHLLGEFKSGNAEIDITKDKSGQPTVWAGESSAYFEAIVLPRLGLMAAAKPDYTIKATALEPDNLKNEPPLNTDPFIVLSFTSGPETIAPGQAMSLPTDVFVGPKQRDLLTSAYYSAYPRAYVQSLVIHGSYCGFLTFNWLVWTLVALLGAFHFVFRDWGLAIICLVCLVRLVLHPITKRSQVNMMRMGKMGPEIERLKKKYGDDKDALNKAMMGVYKDQGLAPVLGCLPMFLQMPIWIALWGALQSTFALRQARFLWGFTWITDLSKPDGVPYLWFPNHAITVPFVNFTITSLNILPILMGVVFYLQQKYTPKPPAATPEQEQQQKMMQWMSLLFPLFLYNGPSGLNLYILTSTTIGIFENRIIRRHIKEREEAEKAGRVFVETKPTRASKETKKDKTKPKDDGKKKSRLRRLIDRIKQLLSDMQQRAEQLRTEAERTKKRRET